ncbi:hypothetical protein J6590_096297 [Homalodisca vitripennis]|nr:hypothetical protein J6590_096297 [Homalodisca vitripennis]
MEKKLTFRSRIQQVVEEFAFMVGPLQQLSPGTSTGGRPTPKPSPSLSTSSYDTLSALTTSLHNGHIRLLLRVRQSAPRNLTLSTCFYQRASWTYPKGPSTRG